MKEIHEKRIWRNCRCVKLALRTQTYNSETVGLLKCLRKNVFEKQLIASFFFKKTTN